MKARDIERFKAGVYKITNLVNSKLYIGSSVNVYQRYHAHKAKLKLKTHSSKHLQSSYYKYGEENFLFEIIEYCENITEREQFWIDELQPQYNKRKIAQNNTGNRLTGKSLEQMRTSLLKRYREGMKSYDQRHKWRKVEQYDMQGNLIKIWDNCSSAEKSLGYCRSTVQKAVKKESLFRFNYQWKYQNDDKVILTDCSLKSKYVNKR